MKKNIVAVALVAAFVAVTALAQTTWRGNLGAAPEPAGGYVLSTSGTALSTTTKQQLQSNLGLGVYTSSTAPATLTAGSIVVSSTNVKIYLTGSTGLVIQTGTTTTF